MNTFVQGQDVVFIPESSIPGESTEWMMGKVQQVLGEGKARRYKVQDADPDIPPDDRVEYRTSATKMVAIPPVGAELHNLDNGESVLALYPDSTTFHKAEVIGRDTATGGVYLHFEGEEKTDTIRLVERRFMFEYIS